MAAGPLSPVFHTLTYAAPAGEGEAAAAPTAQREAQAAAQKVSLNVEDTRYDGHSVAAHTAAALGARLATQARRSSTTRL
jgi:hypothetical protein